MVNGASGVSRRSLVKGLSTGVIASMAGCSGNSGGSEGNNSGGSGGGDADVSFTIASTFEPEHVLVKATKNFKKKIESESDGDVSVEISAGGSYGSEDEIGELVNQGGVEAHAAGSFPYFQYAPAYWFFGCPFVISDYDQLLSVLDSDKMQKGHDTLKKKGNQRPIGQQIYRGNRNFTSNKPIKSPQDVKGLNLRLPELDPWVATWKEVGASPTPIALDELYSALETGTADASEGGASQISSFNLNEVQSHLSLTQHLVANGNMYMNEQFFQGLDQTYRDMILELGEKATEEASQTAMDREENLIDELKSNGMTVVKDVDHEAFRSAAKPAVNRLFKNTWEFDWKTIQNL
ncbi:TRAP transporter substrate-binding protein [Haladaptatus caseinilyticus]|uniref:TRAP transporter substrate-binding protein n=1 Tax=Haladaptatus caseinilyticus TaxID=2993314 RepID=UPI00224A7BD7|nr:TRAP transporter substrate-binding protein [Haladaptatus caseinilyticus]